MGQEHSRRQFSGEFALAAICFLLFALLWLLVSYGWSADVDAVLMLSLHQLSSPALTRAMVILTTLGGAAVLLPFTFGAAGYRLFRGCSRSAIWLLGVTLGGRLAVVAIKALLARVRPDLFPYIVIESGSYPSGHAANSAIVLLSLAVLTGRRTVYLAALAGSFAIGVSRIYLGVHWPSDILAGWLFGIGWVALFAVYNRAPMIVARA
jgi:undecaprenyl-diphosphatase